MLFVRFTSELAEPKLAERIREHAAACRGVPGLLSVVLGREATSGDLCAIYTFSDEAALQGFQRSETAYLLPTAFEVSEARMEVIAPWPVDEPARPIVEDEPLVARIAEALAAGRIAEPDRLAAVVEPYVADLGWRSAAETTTRPARRAARRRCARRWRACRPPIGAASNASSPTHTTTARHARPRTTTHPLACPP